MRRLLRRLVLCALVARLPAQSSASARRDARPARRHEPPPRIAVWRDLYSKTPALPSSVDGGSDGGLLGESGGGVDGSDSAPELTETSISSDDFHPESPGALAPALERIQKAFKAGGRTMRDDRALKALADWDFLPSLNADGTNSFYFGTDATAPADGLLAPAPDPDLPIQKQRMAMALCKTVQTDQPNYATRCGMCQYLLDALVSKTISCRCYKSRLDDFNYRQCRLMRAELAGELERAKSILEERDGSDAGGAGKFYETCQALKYCAAGAAASGAGAPASDVT